MYIAVCEDNLTELNTITSLLDAYKLERRIPMHYRAFSNATEFLASVEKEAFSLYLLDIIMPGINGIDVAKEIRLTDKFSDIIFITSVPDFAYDSYKVHALDYILKPITAKHLFDLLDRIHLNEKKLEEALTLKRNSILVRIPFSQLSFVEVNGKHLYFNMSDGTVHEMPGKLKDFAPLLLDRPEFMQTHRSYIVNMFHVSEFSQTGVITFSNKHIPVSRLIYPKLQKEYMELLFLR